MKTIEKNAAEAIGLPSNYFIYDSSDINDKFCNYLIELHKAGFKLFKRY